MQTTRTLIWLLALALLALVLLALPTTPSARAADPTIVRVKVNGATSGTCGGTWATACGL
jgi:membrane-bound ClpP family serine protease